MKVLYIKALVAVVVMGLAFVGLWMRYGGSLKGTEAKPLAELSQMEEVGVPEFSLMTLDGKKFELSTLKGKIVLVGFWASWCEPCVEEFPSMLKLVEEIPDLYFVAVSADSDEKGMRDFIEKQKTLLSERSVLLWDQQGEARRLYGVERLPETYVVGRDGKLLRKVVGSIDWMTPETVYFFKGQ